jgi:integrase
MWLSAMRHRSPIKALMAEVIITSGMRISEVNSMEVDTLPPRTRWKVVAGRVHFFINKGVKGSKTAPTSNIARRGRTVSLPMDVAERVHGYREETRELQIRRWIREHVDKAEQTRRAAAKPIRLWLSDSSNQPFSNQQLRRVWSDVARCPPGWSPHAGRKYFAVEWLVESASLRMSATHGPADFGWIDQVMRNQIDTFLRPTLGHLSLETTNLYIRGAIWRLADVLGVPSLKYQDVQDANQDPPLENQSVRKSHAIPVGGES